MNTALHLAVARALSLDAVNLLIEKGEAQLNLQNNNVIYDYFWYSLVPKLYIISIIILYTGANSTTCRSFLPG